MSANEILTGVIIGLSLGCGLFVLILALAELAFYHIRQRRQP
jgi:hypothetical protein